VGHRKKYNKQDILVVKPTEVKGISFSKMIPMTTKDKTSTGHPVTDDITGHIVCQACMAGTAQADILEHSIFNALISCHTHSLLMLIPFFGFGTIL
jgi:hypothetical protein